MKTPLKFGVCGIGRIGAQHARVFAKNRDHYQPAAFCDLDHERALDAVARYGGAAYRDFASFLADPAMEFVIIATPSLDHAQNARQALAAGKTVLLEKPIGVTAADFALLQRLDREYPGKLFFCHNHRFEPAFETTRAIIQSGILGEVRIVKLARHHTFGRRNDWQMRLDCGGGQLSVWGPHLLDQGIQLLGAPVRDVWSQLQRILTPGDADDHVRIMLTGENGRLIEIEITNAIALPGPYCTIIGDRGTLTCEQAHKEIRLKYLDPRFQWPAATASKTAQAMRGHWAAEKELPWIEETRPVLPEISMWEQVEIELARHMFAALRLGVPFPIKNADALEVVRITEIVKKQNPQFVWIG